MRRLLYIMMCLTCSMLARAQSTYQYRYWFDNDESRAVTTESGNRLKVDIELDGLMETLHTLHVQVTDEKGVVSSPNTLFFVKSHVPTSGRLKYWFDENTALTGTLSEGSSLIDVDFLPDGIHNLHVQQSGASPSTVVTAMFLKVSPDKDFADGFRYWFDQRKATEKTLKGMTVLTDVDVSGLEDGLHMLHVQATGNSPSAVHSSFFLKTPQVEGVETLTVATSIDGKLVRQEDVPLNGGLLHYDFDATGLSEGVHLLTAQVVSPSGVASTVKSSYFLRVSTAEEHARMKCFYAVDGEKGFTQAGTFSNGTFHFDLDVAELSNGLHRLTYLMVTEGGTASAMRTAFFMKTPLGGNGISAYHYWLNSDYEGRKQVNLEKKANPLNLMSLLPVESVPLRSSQFHFEWTNGKPMIYAQNDFHIRFYDAADRCVDQCKDFTDYSVSREVKDAELLMSGTPVVKDKPAENEIQWYHFPALIGDSLSFKVDRACTVQVFAPSGKEVYSASGSDVVRWDGCHAWEDGEYYLALHDVTAQQGTNTKLEFFQLDKYAVLDYTPNEVGAAPGCFHVSLFGNGFDKLKQARLKLDSETYIAEEIATTDMSNASLKFRLPESDITLGKYDLILDFEDNGEDKPLTISNAIALAEPVYGGLKLDIKSYPRTAKPYPVYVTVQNTGNVAYENIPLGVAYDHLDNIYECTFEASDIKPDYEWIDEDLLCSDTLARAFHLTIPQLMPYETHTVEVGFVGGAHTRFYMYAWEPNDTVKCEEHIRKLIEIWMPGDPNEMHGYLAESGKPYIREDVKDVYYRIEFENDPEIANAAAHHIVITDQLDGSKLDLQSFKPTSVMFGSTQVVLNGSEQSFVKTVDMRPAVNALAQVALDYNAKNGVATWDIMSLDPMTLEATDDAMMGILSVGGMGEVTFDISLKDGLNNGEHIDNMATIVFDLEGAIETPVFTNIMDFTPPTSRVADAELESDSITLYLEGEDSGAGLWHYNIYQQDGSDGIWKMVAEGVESDTCRLARPINIPDYGFCVIATDGAGNVEAKDLHRELSLTDLSKGDLNGDGKIDVADIVAIVEYIYTKTYNADADLNGDNKVDVADIVSIVDIILSLKQ